MNLGTTIECDDFVVDESQRKDFFDKLQQLEQEIQDKIDAFKRNHPNKKYRMDVNIVKGMVLNMKIVPV